MSTTKLAVDIGIERCMIYAMNEAMKRTNIYLSSGQSEELKKISKSLGLSMSEIIRRVIDGYLKRR